jgi:hypothetical protein
VLRCCCCIRKEVRGGVENEELRVKNEEGKGKRQEVGGKRLEGRGGVGSKE